MSSQKEKRLRQAGTNFPELLMNSYKPLLLLLVILCTQWGCTHSKLKPQTLEPAPVRVLYVTSVGWFHDYQEQTDLLTRAIGHRLNSDFDVIVGDIARLRDTDFSVGYDLLIYNFCHAARRDPALIENLIVPVRDRGIPMLAVHCTMHSFQHMNEWYGLLGLKTLRHEEQRSFTLEKAQAHPITAAINFPWELASDELYINRRVASNSNSLVTAYGIETSKHHVQAWLHEVNGTPVVASTLGHAKETLADPQFQQFLANAAAFLTGRLDANGQIDPRYGCDEDCSVTTKTLTKDVEYPTDDERKCVIGAMFESGIPPVRACERACNTKGVKSANECAEQCQISEPWSTPESFWPACKR